MPTDIKATMWFFLCNVLQKGIQYITLPVFSRMLSVEEYGKYTVFLSWLSVIQIIATLNLSAGIYMTGMARYEDKRDEYSSNMIGLSLMVTIIVGIFYFIFYNPLSRIVDLSRILVFVVFVQSFFSPLFLFWSAHERYELRYKELTLITILGSLASPLMSLALIYAINDKALAISIGYIGGQVCMGIYCGICQVRKNHCLYNSVTWREALSFNIPLIPHYLSYVVLGQADRVMINSICGQYEAGIYGLAYQLSNAMNMLTSALDAAFSPQIYMEIKHQKNETPSKLNRILIFYIAASVGVALIAPEILILFGSQKYAEAKWVMPSIILSSYFLFLAGLFMKVEFYFKKNNYITLASTSIAILNIFLNLVFINLYGYIAASYTTLVCYTGFAIAHYFFMRKTAKDNGLYASVFDIKTISLLSILVFVLLAVVLMLYMISPIIRYALVIAISVIVVIYRRKIFAMLKK